MKKAEEKSKNFWELLVESYENDMKRLEEMYSLDSEEESEPISEEEPEPTNIPDSIPVEWFKKKIGWLSDNGIYGAEVYQWVLNRWYEDKENWDKENEK